MFQVVTEFRGMKTSQRSRRILSQTWNNSKSKWSRTWTRHRKISSLPSISGPLWPTLTFRGTLRMRVRIDQWIKIVFRKVEHKQYRYIVILHTFGGKLQRKSNQVKKKRFSAHFILIVLHWIYCFSVVCLFLAHWYFNYL